MLIIDYYPNFFDSHEADELYEKLYNKIKWEIKPVTVFGKTYPQPRPTARQSI